MRRNPALVPLSALVLALGATSCSSSKPTTVSPPAEAGGPVVPVLTGRAGVSPKPEAPKVHAPAPPAGAQYTIYCAAIPGAAHVQQATQFRDQLVRTTGMRDWYVVHNQDDSTLYYGYYKSIERGEDPKEATRARNDREKIDAMVDASGGRPFRHALLVQLTAPDPDAPPAWDLRNAPPTQFWSLQIAAYEGHPDRKKYAVDAVKAFRANGVPAYYYHGDSVSSVCVGTWPRQAARGDLEPAYNDPNEKRTMEQIAAHSPADLIVLSPGLPPLNKEINTKRGRVRAVSAQLEVVDPTLLATMKQYPHHYLNGQVEGMRTKAGVQGKPSFLVQIKRRPDTLLGGGMDATVAADPAPDGSGLSGAARMPRPAAPPPPGQRRLRSLDD